MTAPKLTTMHTLAMAAAAMLILLAVIVYAVPRLVSAQNPDPPEKPARPTVSSASHDSVTLEWTDPGDSSITGYQVLRRDLGTDAPGDFAVIEDDTGTAATSHTDSTVSPSSRYSYRVKARNSNGLSARSGYVFAETLAAPPVPAAPARPTAASVSHGSVTIEWADPGDSSIAGYQILRRDLATDAAGQFAVIVDDTGTAATLHTDATVAASSSYVYRIKARNSTGLSPWSGFLRVDTPTTPTPTPEPTPEPLPTPELTRAAQQLVTTKQNTAPQQDKVIPPNPFQPEPSATPNRDLVRHELTQVPNHQHSDGNCPPSPTNVQAAKSGTRDIRITWSTPNYSLCTDQVSYTLRGFAIKYRQSHDMGWAELAEVSSGSRSFIWSEFLTRNPDNTFTFLVQAIYNASWGKNYSEPDQESAQVEITAVRTDQPPPEHVNLSLRSSVSDNSEAKHDLSWGQPTVFTPNETQYQIKWWSRGDNASGRVVVFTEVERDSNNVITDREVHICHDLYSLASDGDQDWSDNLCSHSPWQAQDFFATPKVWPRGVYIETGNDSKMDAYEGSIHFWGANPGFSFQIRACGPNGCSQWVAR